MNIKEFAESILTPRYEKITIFAFIGENGQWRVAKGTPTQRIIKAVIRACSEEGVKTGWIAYKEEEGKKWVDVSPSFPLSARTRVQTIVLGLVQ